MVVRDLTDEELSEARKAVAHRPPSDRERRALQVEAVRRAAWLGKVIEGVG